MRASPSRWARCKARATRYADGGPACRPARGTSGAPVSTSAPTSSGRAAASRTAIRPPSECPTTTSPAARALPRSSSRRATAAAYSADPHGLGGGRGGTEAREVGGHGGKGPLGARAGPREGGEVGMGAAPSVERDHRRGPLSPRLAVQRPTGERPQHPGRLPPGAPGPRPSPAPIHPADTVASVPSSTSRVAGSSELLHGLTQAQQQAVMSPDAPLCVLAAAGSGKTTVLARRVARRILDGSARAEHTLVVTFTRKASHELRERLRQARRPERDVGGDVPRPGLRPVAPPLGGPRAAAPGGGRRSRPRGAGRCSAPGLRTSRRLRRRGPRGAALGPGEHARARPTTAAAALAAGRDTLLDISHQDIAEVYAAYVARREDATSSTSTTS